MKIKKGDMVKIIGGNDRGKQGRVLAVLPGAGKIIVESIFVKKKHVRPRKQGQKGELVTIPSAFPASRAMLLCGRCSKPSRTGFRTSEGQKVRVCKRCGAQT